MQVACLLLDDTVPNRIHWPRQAELKINGMVYRPYGRNSNTKLGANARDEPANAAHRCSPGNNRISLHCAEDRQFGESCILVSWFAGVPMLQCSLHEWQLEQDCISEQLATVFD